MLIHLLILVTCQVIRSSQDDLQAEFINQLSNLNEWKTLALVLNENDQTQRWVNNILVSKVIVDLTDDYRPRLTDIDAYIIFTDNSAVMQGLERGLDSGKVDPLNTFVLMLEQHSKILSWRTKNKLTQLDWILVWYLQSRQEIIFQRHRKTSSLSQHSDGRFHPVHGLDTTGIKILSDQSFSLHNEVVKVSAFLHPPTTSPCEDGKGLCGRDINMIQLISDKLQFRPQFVKPPNNIKWGSFVNGSWTGLIGEVQKGAAELGVANLYLAGPYLKHIEFSYPYGLTCSSFMVPPPQPFPQWRALVRPFDLTLWLVSLSVLFSGGVFLYWACILYRYLFKRSANNHLHRFANAMMYNLGAITWMNRGDYSVMPIRSFNSFWSLFCFLLATIYRTALIAALSIPTLEPPIDTMLQLARSGLQLYGYNNLFNQLAQLSHDPHVIEMGERYRSVSKNQTIVELIDEGDNAFLESKDFLNYLVATSPRKNRNAAPHVMHECVTAFPVGIGFTPGSALKVKIDPILQQMSAAGLLDHWMQSTILRYRSSYQANDDMKMKSSNNKKKPFSLYHLEGVFFLLLFCSIISLFVFSLELIVFKFRK